MGRVAGKIAVVTGAAQGLGEADARLLAAEGARVIMTDINDAAGQAIAQEIGADYQHHDVTDEDQWDALMAHVRETFGGLDILVNNAGIAVVADIETTTTAQWRKTIATHLDSTFWGCQKAVEIMKETGGGSIINMSSIAALVGTPVYLAYSAAKGGIRSMTRSVAIHCKQNNYNIRCDSIHPGAINTPMVHAAFAATSDINLAESEDIEATRLELGIGEPNDIAYMVLYLASDESKHVNGAEMVVDNGDTAS